MKDGRLRRGIKALARFSYAADQRLVEGLRRRRGDQPYRLAGDCRLCARCCEAPSIQVGRAIWYLATLRSLFIWWQRSVNGFELVRKDRPRTFVFRCTHFDTETRRCDSYESRPGMCRDYPRGLLWQASPELFPECGYRPVAFNAEALLAALSARNLEPEQLAAMKKRLFVE